jgi:hypothetical protein
MSPILLLLMLTISPLPISTFWSEFYQYRGPLIFNEDFHTFNTSRWQHIITAWRGGNQEFEYYTDRAENRSVAVPQLI